MNLFGSFILRAISILIKDVLLDQMNSAQSGPHHFQGQRWVSAQVHVTLYSVFAGRWSWIQRKVQVCSRTSCLLTVIKLFRSESFYKPHCFLADVDLPCVKTSKSDLILLVCSMHQIGGRQYKSAKHWQLVTPKCIYVEKLHYN